jgi:hypothetical protein
MRKEQIVVGKAYVNSDETIMREVVEDIDENCILVNGFDLTTGMLLPTRHRIHHRGQLARWACREATEAERASVHPYQAESWYHPLSRYERAGIPLREAKSSSTEPGPHTFPRAK